MTNTVKCKLTNNKTNSQPTNTWEAHAFTQWKKKQYYRFYASSQSSVRDVHTTCDILINNTMMRGRYNNEKINTTVKVNKLKRNK
jgi:hypothetical protein